MPRLIIEWPSACASLKVWEEYRARLDKFSDAEIPRSQKEAANSFIAHLRAKEASKARSADL